PADRWASPNAFAEALTAPASARAPSVAVLPFLNLSADPENEYFADGITEDVIAHLSKIRALKVISRTSVMAFKQREQSLTELGEAGAMRPDEAYARAKAASATALALDPELGEAHCMLAFIKAVCDFDWVGAEQEFKRALELTPNSADTYDLYGRMCLAVERNDDALAMERRAQELDPLAHRADVARALLR